MPPPLPWHSLSLIDVATAVEAFSLTVRSPDRQPIILGPPRIAAPPIGVAHGAQPLWDGDGERIQDMPQRFADDLDAIQRPHRRKYMRGVGPLAAMRLNQLVVTAPLPSTGGPPTWKG
jgi:hypothetical protein